MIRCWWGADVVVAVAALDGGLRQSADAGQRVTDVVGQTGDHLTGGSQTLLLDQLGLHVHDGRRHLVDFVSQTPQFILRAGLDAVPEVPLRDLLSRLAKLSHRMQHPPPHDD